MKKFLPLIVVVVLAIGAGSAYLLTRDNNKSTNGSSSSQQASSGSGFDALSTSGTSFVATITTNVDGKDALATMEYDKDSGNVRYTSTVEGQNIVMVYTKDAYYMCQSADQCIKYPLSQSQSSSFDPKTYEYSDEELASWRNSAVDQGKKDCSTGTCYVWKVSAGGYDSSVYVDTKTKRIAQVEGTVNGVTSKIVYEYKDVSITPPANAQALPSL